MKLIAKWYVKISGRNYTPGEVIDNPVMNGNIQRLLDMGAVKPMTSCPLPEEISDSGDDEGINVTADTDKGESEEEEADAPGADTDKGESEEEEADAPDADTDDGEVEEEADAPEIDVADGIVTDEAPKPKPKSAKGRKKA